MAGTVAKLVYPSGSSNIGDPSYLTHTTVVGTMDEDDIVRLLNEPNFNKRSDALDILRASVRRNGGRLPFSNKLNIFKGLAKALGDSNWDIRHQTIQLIHEMLPQFGEDLDLCMSVILPKLVPNLGDSKITIRRAVIQTLHVYMKYANDIQKIFRAIVHYGIENSDARVRKESIVSLPMLFTPEFSSENFFEIAQALAKRMLDNSTGDENMQRSALLTLEKIKKLVGEQTFNSYIQKLSPPLRNYYYKQTDTSNYEPEEMEESRIAGSPKKSAFSFSGGNNFTAGSPSSSRRTTPSHAEYPYSKGNDQVKQSTALLHYQPPESYKFGIVPSQIMDRLNDQNDFRSRAQAVEELKLIVMDLRDVSELMPHILQFIAFLSSLLEDTNFNITTLTLDILGLLVDKLNGGVKPHVKPLVLALTKRMGDNKTVIRQSVMKVVMQLMQTLSPKPVLNAISDNLSHRNSRVRQETLNIIIASLLTFPSYDFHLGSLCQTIAHTLVDPKRQVRQAALECFAVLAQAMGAGKLQPLVQAVDSVELGYDGEGVMAAVQARLARRQLPRVNAENLVDYATPVPTSGTVRGANSMPQGADIDWILAASGGSGNSARSARSDNMELESVTSSARSTPASMVGESMNQPRRYLSAGKNKNRLPWETNNDATDTSNGHSPTTPQRWEWEDFLVPKRKPKESSPLKPRTTWGGEEMSRSLKSDADKKKSFSRHQTFGHGRPNSRDPSPDTGIRIIVTGAQSPELRILEKKPPIPFLVSKTTLSAGDTGSYRHIHMNKYKRSLDASSQPFSVHSNRDSPESSAPNTPRTDAFSNSWPESAKIFDETSKSNKKKLDPITGSDTTLPSYVPNWANEHVDDRSSKEKSPIPTKPTLARGASSKRKVPPIQTSDKGSNHGNNKDEDFLDSARDSGYDLEDSQNEQEMMSSLKQIRNSATKKKAERLFERLESQEKSPSPPVSASDTSESGIFSNVSEESRSRKGSRKQESPFESKPRLARNNSVRDVTAKLNNNNKADSNHIDFKPHGGVTFRENHNPNVSIVGRGYAEDSHVQEPKPAIAHKRVERRRSNANNNRAVYDKEPEVTPAFGMGVVPAPRERRSSRTEMDPRNLPQGVVGVGVVKQNSLDKQDSMSSPDDEEEEEMVISMSKSTRDRMAAKVQRRQEEAELVKQREKEERDAQRDLDRLERERERLERERREFEIEAERERERQARAQEYEERKARERERQQEKLRKLPTKDPAEFPDTQEITSPTSEQRKPPTQQRRKTRPPTQEPESPQRTESENLDILLPFKDPQTALQDALRMMDNDDWETKMTGVTYVRRLVDHHPDRILSQLHDVTIKLLAEVKNLRSQVSRLAIVCFAELYTNLGKAMDTDLDMTVRTLLMKNSDTNVFIREDVEKALVAMTEHVTPQRAMIALISCGASHRNVLIRKLTSCLLVQVVDKMGPGRVLSGVKDMTDKILPAGANFLLDASPECRHYGSRMLYALMFHEDFDKAMTKHVPAATLRTIQDKLEKLKKRGPSDPPSGTNSATARRSGQGSRSSSMTRTSSASSGINEPACTPSTKRRTATVRTNDATMEEIKGVCGDMGASDWRERHKGITQFKEMAENNPDAIGANIVRVFDKFIPCLKDSNSKVNLFALQVLHSLTPVLCDHLASVSNLTIQTVASNLGSKNKEIYDSAAACLDAFMEHLDGAALLQPFASQAQSGNKNIKPDMIERVAFLITQVYPRKPKQVVLHTLPLLWHLLSAMSGSGGGATALRDATVNLVAALYSEMGSQLLDQANSKTNITPKMVALLEEMLDAP